MGFGKQGVGKKLFVHDRQNIKVNWWKGQNAKLHILLPL
jgi:hypothetical protein